MVLNGNSSLSEKLPTNRRTTALPDSLALRDRLVILVMFLLPMPSLFGDAAARFADAVRFGAVSGHLLLSPSFTWGRQVWRTSAVLLLMFLCACASLVYGTSHSLRDLLDVLRSAAFWIVFLFGASVAWKGRSSTSAVISFSQLMLMIGLLNAVFSIGQYYFPDLTRPLQYLYATGELRLLRMELIAEQGRAIGFFANPNINAVMLLLLALPSVSLFQLTSQRRYLIIGSIVFATILLTGSRTGLILLAAVIAVLCIASRKLSYLVALAIICAGSYYALDVLVQADVVTNWFPYLSELLLKIHGAFYGEYFDVESINSFNARYVIWDDALEWYRVNPVLGSGPLRDVLPSYADNYYVYLLSRYGLAGLTLYSVFSLFVATLCVRAILSKQRPHEQWGVITLAALVAVNLANYTIDAFLTVPIASATLLYAGYLTCLMDLHPDLASERRGIRSIKPSLAAAKVLRGKQKTSAYASRCRTINQ